MPLFFKWWAQEKGGQPVGKMRVKSHKLEVYQGGFYQLYLNLLAKIFTLKIDICSFIHKRRKILFICGERL